MNEIRDCYSSDRQRTLFEYLRIRFRNYYGGTDIQLYLNLHVDIFLKMNA